MHRQMGPHRGPHGLQRIEFRQAGRTAIEMPPQQEPAHPTDLAIEKCRQMHPGLLMIHRAASCLSQALRSASRARDSRDITVPPATPVTSAISL